jgi:hypothetical protein
LLTVRTLCWIARGANIAGVDRAGMPPTLSSLADESMSAHFSAALPRAIRV